MASKQFVNGRVPKTRHGQEDAKATTSIGGPFPRINRLWLIDDNSQRDPSRNIIDSKVMKNRGTKRISTPDRFSIAGDGIHSEEEDSRSDFWHVIGRSSSVMNPIEK